MRAAPWVFCALLGCGGDDAPPGPPEPPRAIAFEASAVLELGMRASAARLVDWNLDGRLDLVVVGDGGVTRGVAGSGGYSLVAGEAEFSPGGVAVLDLDGDGDADYAFATAAGVRLRYQDGTGRMVAPVTDDPLAGAGTLLASGDLDGDGRADLVSVGPHAFRVLWGHEGKPEKGVLQSLVEPAVVQAVTLGDLDGDGRDELLLARASGEVSIFRFDAERHLDAPLSIAVPGSAGLVSATDLDGNGRAELLVGTTSPAGLRVVWRALGEDTVAYDVALPQPPVALTAADLDGDGDRDVVVALETSGAVIRLANDGDGILAARETVAAGTLPVGLLATDVDGDGGLDVVVIDRRAAVVLRQVDGKLTGAPYDGLSPAPLWSLVAGDLDGDGKTDFASDREGVASVRLGKGGELVLPVGAGAHRLAVGDLDGDGRDDLALAVPGGLDIFSDLGAGPRRVELGLTSASGIGAGDLDGDERTDLAIADGDGDRLVIVPGKGPSREIAVPGSPSDVQLADLDGDGRDELVVARRGSDRIAVLGPDGSSRFEVSVSAPQQLVVGDVDGDGRLDVAVLNGELADQVTLFAGDGAGRLERVDVEELSGGAADLLARDLDGDGVAELIAVLPDAGLVVVLRRDPMVDRFSRLVYAAGGFASAVAAADENGDGLVDLMVGGRGLALLRGR